mmetsp:Transcript_90179/g.291503  ORF Transcript_90179/g.291503 Transcript_90179/m.291503 type:complete len:212 (+) Transcript_90179:910-1545(+)
MYFESNSGPLTVKKRKSPLVSCAAACTRNVLPHPGGPTNIMPLRPRTGDLSIKTAYFVGMVSISINSCFGSCMPPISLSLTSEDKKVWSAIEEGTNPSVARSKCRRARRGCSHNASPFGMRSVPASKPVPASDSASTHARCTRPARSATLKPSTRPPQPSNAPSCSNVSSICQPSATFFLSNICKISGLSFSNGDLRAILCSNAGGFQRAR